MTTSGYYVYIIMGVSGCGKSTIGKLLAKELSIPFFDGDDYHPASNIQKMSEGIPLNDTDRHGWLTALNLLAKQHAAHGAVIACSALKENYRKILKKDIESKVRLIYLEGSIQEIQERLTNRKGHFMPTALLKSQFDILEPPSDAITVSISLPPEKIVEIIRSALKTMKKGIP